MVGAMSTLTNETTKTQCQRIAAHLQAGHKITPLDALSLFGCFRLGARIWDLRNNGMQIERELVQVNGKRVARYYIE